MVKKVFDYLAFCGLILFIVYSVYGIYDMFHSSTRINMVIFYSLSLITCLFAGISSQLSNNKRTKKLGLIQFLCVGGYAYCIFLSIN